MTDAQTLRPNAESEMRARRGGVTLEQIVAVRQALCVFDRIDEPDWRALAYHTQNLVQVPV